MKNLILFLLLLPFFCSSQTLTLNDTTYNVTLQFDTSFVSTYPELPKDMEVVSMSNSYNTIIIDTVSGTIEVTRDSKLYPEGSITMSLEIISIKESELYGTTYNLYDYYNGNYGFLFVKKDGTIIFSLQDMAFINEYHGYCVI